MNNETEINKKNCLETHAKKNLQMRNDKENSHTDPIN